MNNNYENTKAAEETPEELDESEFITITDENGREMEVEVIHYFTLESNNKDYVVYTNNQEDENGNVLVFTSEVMEENDCVKLLGIEDAEVVKEITQILTDIINE